MLTPPRFRQVCLLWIFLLSSVATCIGGALSVHPLFSDGAVLQRELPVKVWGKATPNRTVTVHFRAQTVTAETDVTGAWSATLAPEPAGGPHPLLIRSDEDEVTVKDVYVGEVWFASGQSNMQYRIRYMKPEDRPVLPAPDASFRILNIRQRTADAPLAATHSNDRWLAVDETSIREFSAVGFFFGQSLRQRLDVPVGIIASAVGGTSIRSWISPEGLAAAPEVRREVEAAWATTVQRYPAARERYETDKAKWDADKAAAEAAGRTFDTKPPRAPDGPDSPRKPYGLFNGMVAPVVPYTVRGVLWYQGESDAGSLGDRYGSLLIALIRDWRARWNQPEMPFLFVQLPGFAEGKNWAGFRQQQASALGEPRTGMTVAIDLGEENDVHPRNKRPVGERLANLALRDVYGRSAPVNGPRPAAVLREGAKVRLTFACEPGAQLEFKPGTIPSGFELRGPDAVFLPAQVALENGALVLSHPQISEPVEVRYAWSNWPGLSVFDSNRLPAAPFTAAVKTLP